MSSSRFTAAHPWAILAAGACIQLLTGLPAAWGVFQQPVMEEYALAEEAAALAFSVLIAAYGVGCVLGGFLQDRRGPRCAALWGTALLEGGLAGAALLPSAWGWAMPWVFSVPAGLGTAFHQNGGSLLRQLPAERVLIRACNAMLLWNRCQYLMRFLPICQVPQAKSITSARTPVRTGGWKSRCAWWGRCRPPPPQAPRPPGAGWAGPV